MSQHHTDTDSHGTSTNGALEQFIRNRYFNGKLLTKRDMQAEQEYHAGRLETVAQHVLGEGVVCGLDTTVSADDSGGVTVSLTTGLAIDGFGRPIVVDSDTEISFTADDLSGDDDTQYDDFSLFITFDRTKTEEVPTPGSHDACSEDCEYNRFVENYSLRLAEGPPTERKPIPEVEFPTASELSQPNTRGDSDEPHQSLSKVARTYYGGTNAEGFHYDGCAEGDDRHVFLGYYEKTSDGWEHKPVEEPRHHVYSNNMLYASIVDHATNFDNPHEVHLAVEQSADGTLLRNERGVSTDASPPYPGDVLLASDDDVLNISGSTSDDTGKIAFDLGAIVEVGPDSEELSAPFGLRAGDGASLSIDDETVIITARGDGPTGEGNTAEGENATVPGGENNTANGDLSTVGGGDTNEATGNEATIGGGTGNVATGDESTVSGGLENEARAEGTAIAGGQGNGAAGSMASIGGGEGNTAGGNHSNIGGGGGNTTAGSGATVGGGVNNTADGENATVPGGEENIASGQNSLAAGIGARAGTDRSFVWSSTDDRFTSTGGGQFLVDAPWVGLGTDNPATQLHVEGERAMNIQDGMEPENALRGHVAAIENSNPQREEGSNVLALAMPAVEQPTPNHNFVSFVTGGGPIASIQGNGQGGVQFSGESADFAEYFPKADPDSSFEQGQVVGLREGEVVDYSTDVDTVLVVSTGSIVAGNRPIDGDTDDYVKLSLVGQVPVRVRGPVNHGDYLVASSADGGTAVARSTCESDSAPPVGQALENLDKDEGTVLALIGAAGTAVSSDLTHRNTVNEDSEQDIVGRNDRIDTLEAENDRLREELAAKEDRIDALEERLAVLEAHVASESTQATADD